LRILNQYQEKYFIYSLYILNIFFQWLNSKKILKFYLKTILLLFLAIKKQLRAKRETKLNTYEVLEVLILFLRSTDFISY